MGNKVKLNNDDIEDLNVYNEKGVLDLIETLANEIDKEIINGLLFLDIKDEFKSFLREKRIDLILEGGSIKTFDQYFDEYKDMCDTKFDWSRLNSDQVDELEDIYNGK